MTGNFEYTYMPTDPSDQIELSFEERCQIYIDRGNYMGEAYTHDAVHRADLECALDNAHIPTHRRELTDYVPFETIIPAIKELDAVVTGDFNITLIREQDDVRYQLSIFKQTKLTQYFNLLTYHAGAVGHLSVGLTVGTNNPLDNVRLARHIGYTMGSTEEYDIDYPRSQRRLGIPRRHYEVFSKLLQSLDHDRLG